MILYRILGLIYVVKLIPTARASPVPLADDGSAVFLQKIPSNESVFVKRLFFGDNSSNDKQLKEISLSSLVGDLEKNIYASALSFSKAVTEIKVDDDAQHDVSKRQPLTKEEENVTTTESNANLPANNKTIVQTAEKVARSSDDLPTHIAIDRIGIQPLTGGLAMKPVFELKHNEKNGDGNKEHAIAKTIISNTELIGSVTTPSDPSLTISYLSDSITVIANTTTTTEPALKTLITPKNIEQLKEAEEELKEKFAEIEAEPIILSARV